MSLDAIKTVTAAEEHAEKIRADAQLQAKQMLNDAEKQGKALFADARTRASEALIAMDQEVVLKSKTAAEEIAQRTTEAGRTLRQEAMGRMDKAVAIIIGRIVNG